MTIQGLLAIVCVELLIVQQYVPAQQVPPPNQQMPASSQQGAAQQTLVPDQLDSLVAPIALYPDPILSQVLVASTYPLEIVEAARWLSQNSSLQGKALVDAAAKQSWDASVQALVVLPDLLKRLNQEITWTSDLGNAFLAQQQDVMEAVQRMRQKAESNGALQSTKEQQVTTAAEGGNTYIEIQPASPEVVYVPQYDPVAVWGPSAYPYPPIYYPPSTGAVIAAGAISFGVGMAVGAIWGGGWGGWGWGCGWGRNNVVINNNFISSNHFNRTNVANGNNWVHSPVHRGGVPYNNRNVANRFNAAQGKLNARPTVAQTQQRLNQSNLGQRPGNGPRPGQSNLGAGGNAFRPSQGNPAQRPAAAQRNVKPSGRGDRVGNRSVGGGGGNGGAFGGMNQGGNRARMNSSRGFSSGGGARGGGGRGGGRRR
jgi:Protein of unknown function (DUF3300)